MVIQSKMENVYATLTAKATVIILLSSISVICASATNHTVGGPTGWALVSNLQNWTRTTVFYPGDNLEFIYTPLHDVLEVDQDGFSTCQTSKPISTHNDGDTIVPLDQPGTRYFICGTAGHCKSGLKVQVDVLSNSNDTTSRPSRPPSSPTKRPPPPKSRSPPTPLAQTPPAPTQPAPIIPRKGPSPVPAFAVQPHTASLLVSLPLIIIIFMWDA